MAEKQYRIGIDLGGTNIKVGVIDADNRLLGKLSMKTRSLGRDWHLVVADMAAQVNHLLEELDIAVEECIKIGVGSPGMVDHIAGVVTYAGNFEWEYVPLLAELRCSFPHMPMRLANDANCAVLGEAVAGAAKGARHVVLITLGTGVGGGVIVDGRLQEGGSAGGMELGHTLLKLDGELCTCGRHGCLEAYASASALTRQARAAAEGDKHSAMHALCGGNLGNMNGIIPFKAARQGDQTAQRVVDTYIRYLGEGIINFINIWRPEKVLLGGGVSNEGPPLIDPLNDYVRPRAFGGERGYVAPVVQATLGNDAGLIGAASL